MKEIEAYLEKHGFGHFCPKAVLFDMDGVIYDSMPNHAASWHDSMADCGLDMPHEAAYMYEGMRGVETIKLLARQQWGRALTDEEAARLYAHKADLFSAYTEQTPARIMPGIRELMKQMKQCGLTICVVTGSGQRTLLDRLLTDFGGLLSEELIVTAFDVKHGKPSPEPYLKGMEKCGVEPWQTIVVENAPLGVRAAVAARCMTIAVNTGPLDDSQLAGEGASFVFNDMCALSSAWLPMFERMMPENDERMPVCQAQRWEQNFQALSTFVATLHRLPSRHHLEDHRLLNWIKYNRKRIAAGLLNDSRKERFEALMASAEKYHKINQHSYVDHTPVVPTLQELPLFGDAPAEADK